MTAILSVDLGGIDDSSSIIGLGLAMVFNLD
jgi:hypothetical protein